MSISKHETWLGSWFPGRGMTLLEVVGIGLVAIVAQTIWLEWAAAGEPLKVFMLAGQSNMQGKAKVRTIERLSLTEDSKPMYDDMKVTDGLPSAVDGVFGVYLSGGDWSRGSERPVTVDTGPLKPGLSETTSTTNFGPEYTFAIEMRKHLKGPFLIIKTAWGGRNLLQQFRPPSAGPFAEEKDKHGNPTGHYYNLIVKLAKEVLADPGKYHPEYNAEDGYELAGFVWFQGYNDLIGDYSSKDGKQDFSEYSRLLECFIRDIRKDMDAPSMPFVIGVMGIGGKIEDPKNSQFRFRESQAAPASLPEFAGNVIAVKTDDCWDMELVRIQHKMVEAAQKKVQAEDPNLKGKAFRKAIEAAGKAMSTEALTPEEVKILETGVSNEAYHYMGSAYIYGKIGKALAEGMIKLEAAK